MFHTYAEALAESRAVCCSMGDWRDRDTKKTLCVFAFNSTFIATEASVLLVCQLYLHGVGVSIT